MAEITLAILAGGKSSRFGSNKALADWHGKPLVAHLLDTLGAKFPARMLVAKDPAMYAGLSLGAPVVPDAHARFHPLAGIVAALRTAETPWVLVVGCDMPLVSWPLLDLLAAAAPGHDAAVPLWDGHAQPMCGMYAKAAEPRFAAFLEEADLKCCKFLKKMNTRYLSPEEVAAVDPDGRTFLDTDTPEAFLQAQALSRVG
jgi:molybdopterin-guanine dinucleotide biosynthesis protein A